MRYFALLDLQHVVLSVFLGLIALLLLVVAFGTYGFRRPPRALDEDLEEYPEGIREAIWPC